MDKKISKIIFRQDEKTNMNSIVLAEGEPAIAREFVNGKYVYTFKIGDGKTIFASLPEMSAEHVIQEPLQDGEYLRKKQGDAYSWVTLDNNIKNLSDLLLHPYDEELDMGYSITDPSNTVKKVYGIRKYFITSANKNEKITQEIAIDVHSILDCGGYVVAGNDGRVSINASSDICNSAVYTTPDYKLNISTTCLNCDRTDNIVDVWVIYTKI